MGELKSKQDEFLLLALKNGDRAAFNVIYARYRRAFLLKFRKGFQSEEVAQDSLQELFLKVWKSHQSIDPRQSFRSYLNKIAEHMIIDFYRAAARARRMQFEIIAETPDYYSHIEENLVTKEKRLLVNQIIDQLPVKQRHVFRMFKLEGKSYKEISGQLGISMSTINKHVYAANTYLKERILSKSDIFMSCLLTVMVA